MLATIAPATGGQAFLTQALCSLALDAAQCPFASEIAAEGRGSMVYHALANEGTVPARDFAVWVCLEQSCSRVSHPQDWGRVYSFFACAQCKRGVSKHKYPCCFPCATKTEKHTTDAKEKNVVPSLVRSV